MIRLKQTVSGQVVYTTLMEPRKLTGDTILPVKFKSIEGAYGVDQGEVEVVIKFRIINSHQTIINFFQF